MTLDERLDETLISLEFLLGQLVERKQAPEDVGPQITQAIIKAVYEQPPAQTTVKLAEFYGAIGAIQVVMVGLALEKICETNA